tara:strand:- start:8013 stop:9215 length:1203 start_codon:yes stop_codon:yes gene_type:complete
MAAHMFQNLRILQFAFAEISVKIIPVLTTFVMAKYLPIYEFGRLALYVVTIELFFVAISNNASAVYRVQYFKKPSRMRAQLAQSAIQNSLLISLVIVAGLLISENTGIYLGLIVVALFRAITVVLLANFQCQRIASMYLWVNLAFVFIFVLSLWGFSVSGISILAWLKAMLVASLLQMLLAGVSSASRSVVHTKKVLPAVNKYMFLAGISFMPQAIGWWAKSGADRFQIEFLYGSSVLALYSLSYQFAALVILAANILNLAYVPDLNHSLKLKDRTKVRSVLQQNLILVGLISLIAIMAGWVILNNYYSEYETANIVFIEILASTTFFSASLLYINVYYFFLKQIKVAVVIAISALAQLLIAFLIGASTNIYVYSLAAIFVNILTFGYVYIDTRRLLNND